MSNRFQNPDHKSSSNHEPTSKKQNPPASTPTNLTTYIPHQHRLFVSSFNSLPRPERRRDQENNWHFSVHKSASPEQGAFLFLFNTSFFFVFSKNLPDITQFPYDTQAQLIYIPLLKAFMDGFSSASKPKNEVEKFAPWKWSTSDEELAVSMEGVFRRYGVIEELCKVHVVDDSHAKIAKKIWVKYCNKHGIESL